MSNDLTTQNKSSKELDWQSQEVLEELKAMYGKGLSDTEWKTFIGIGRATGLNPINREIWAYKFGNAPATVFIGRDGYRISAFRNPRYSSHRVEAVYEKDTFTINEDGSYKHVTPNNMFLPRGELVGAYCVVKFRDRQDTMQVMVSAKEYKKGQSTWNTLPETMLKKVAEAQALRMSFPEMFNGTYHEYEKAPTQTEVLKEQLGVSNAKKDGNKHAYKTVDIQTGEILEEVGESFAQENKTDDSAPINIDQLTAIRDLMLEKNFNAERKAKALEYFKVEKFEEMTYGQANIFLMQLEKI